MIKIENLSKTYISKKGENKDALTNINMNISSKGFVFILGKSGSGKSTLLNLLGGLDKPTSGDIFVNGQTMSSFSNKEYDYYRNSYIGFIFQDYNVLEDSNVFENVALPLKLQNAKGNIEKDVKSVLNRLGIGHLIYRNTNELSGGQLQRVAIARALVKDPKIILADEATGNLDSSSGFDVLETLKELSLSKLVIMVTHDEETAKNYGDRIIEISDGEVINDYSKDLNNKTVEVERITKEYIIDKLPVSVDVSSDDFKLRKSYFPKLSALSLAFTNLLSTKVRLLFTLILFSMTLVIFGFTTINTTYDSNFSASKTFEKNSLEYYDLQYCSGELDLERITSCLTHSSAKSKLYDDSVLTDFMNINDINVYPKVDFSSEIFMSTPSLFGNSFYYTKRYMYEPTIYNDFVAIDNNNHFEVINGEYPTEPNEVLISDFMADYIKRVKNYNAIVGRDLPVYNSNTKLKISGIFKTDYLDYQELFDILVNSELNKDEKSLMSEFLLKRDTLYKSLLVSKERFTNPIETSIKGIVLKNNYSNDYKVNFLNYDLFLKYENSNPEFYPRDLKIDNIKDNEVVLYASELRKYFDVERNDVKHLDKNISLLDNYLNKTITIKPHPASYNKLKNTLEFKIVGFIDDTMEYNYLSKVFNYDETNIFVNQYLMSNLTKNEKEYNGLVAYFNNIDANAKFLKVAYDNNFIHSTEVSNVLYTYEKTSDKLLLTLILSSIGLGIFTLVLFNSFISHSIKNKTKEIGILRAIGAKSKDVSNIFTIQGLIVGIVSSIIGVLLLFVCTYFANENISKDLNIQIYIYNTGLLEVILILVISIIIVYLSSFFSTKIITNKKPIDAIRNK